MRGLGLLAQWLIDLLDPAGKWARVTGEDDE